jgi:hypothetical protein
MLVTVGGETPTILGCTYVTSGSSCLSDGEIAAAFDLVEPNLVVTVTHEGQAVAGAFVVIGDGPDRVDLITDSDGKVRVNLPAGTYVITVVSNRVQKSGSKTVTLDGSGVLAATVDLSPPG